MMGLAIKVKLTPDQSSALQVGLELVPTDELKLTNRTAQFTMDAPANWLQAVMDIMADTYGRTGFPRQAMHAVVRKVNKELSV